jgi:hypothetical protein
VNKELILCYDVKTVICRVHGTGTGTSMGKNCDAKGGRMMTMMITTTMMRLNAKSNEIFFYHPLPAKSK